MIRSITPSLIVSNNAANPYTKKTATASDIYNFSDKCLAKIPAEKIHPEIFGIRLNRKPLFFCGFGSNSDFSQKDLKAFKQILSKCRFDKVNLLNQGLENFKVTLAENGINLHNFHRASNEETIQGTSEELIYSVGKKLQKDFGDKYIFVAIKGIFSKDTPHHYMVAFKNTSENKEKLEKLILNSKKAAQLVAQTENDIKNGNCSIRNMSMFPYKLQELLPNADNFKGGLLIDPSFGIIKKFSPRGTIRGYTQHDTFNIDDMKPSEPYRVPSEYCIPLGTIKDIAPELKSQYGAKTVLMIKLERKANSIKANICTPQGKYFFQKAIEDKLGKHHPIVEFVNICTK